jgi:hypothetical protein
MRGDPESVLHAAYDAVAKADAARLLPLVEPASLGHLHGSLVELLEKQRLAVGDGGEAGRRYAHFLSRYRVRTPEELRGLAAGDLLERLVHSHPSIRSTLACDTLGHSVDEALGLAEVRFRVYIGGRPEPLGGVKTATLKHVGGAWKLVTRPFNDWVVPGLENTFFGVPGSGP